MDIYQDYSNNVPGGTIDPARGSQTLHSNKEENLKNLLSETTRPRVLKIGMKF